MFRCRPSGRPIGDDHLMGLRIDAALAPVRRDLDRSGLPTPRVLEAVRENLGEWVPGTEVVVQLDGNELSSFAESDTDADADRIVTIADRVQEWLIESVLWPERPTNWPSCPAHPKSHPLAARAVGAVAIWCCPLTGDEVAEVGQVARWEY